MNKINVDTLFHIEPPVDGGFGRSTIIEDPIQTETNIGIPNVRKLEFAFDDWLGNEIVTSFPCHLISNRILESLKSAEVTGLNLKDVLISKSEQFLEIHGNIALPEFFWLVPIGRISAIPKFLVPKRDLPNRVQWSGHDVCLGPRAELVFSRVALDAIDLHLIPECKIRAFSFFCEENL